MLWSLPLLPLLAGAAIWAQPRRGRPLLGSAGVVALLATLALAVWATATGAMATFAWGVEGLSLYASVDRIAGVMAVLVPALALPIVVYAAAHEPARGLRRLIGLLVVFVGAMQLLIVAADLLTLLIGWELVGWVSWALIAHEWSEPGKAGGAAHAFTTTRLGDLGLFLAAMATFAGTGSLRYADLPALAGPLADVAVFGIVLAGMAKSAQLPFSPWLFSAMAGPTPVSALLHAATMVAAGVYLLARLQPILDTVAWFAPALVAAGALTAVVGGVVASLQPHAKKLLAASTSAHYGLMLVAIGAGFPSVALAHLVAHGFFKALLFLAAGVAITGAGSEQLARMRLGSRLPGVAWLALVGSLALAGVPPLGGAWTKEAVIVAAGRASGWLTVIVMAAGGLSAFYAARFQLLAYGTAGEDGRVVERPGPAVRSAVAALALGTAGLGTLWLPGARELVGRLAGGMVPAPTMWELVGSLLLAGAGLSAAYKANRQRRLVTLGLAPAAQARLADWFGLPALVKRLIVDPALALCGVMARLDDRVIDAGVRGAAANAVTASRVFSLAGERTFDRALPRAGAAAAATLARGSARAGEGAIDGMAERIAAAVGVTGRGSRRLQTGLSHHYYLFIAVGLAIVAATAALWRS
jgi:NADH-quinone oxidoreductase subunit L